MSKRKLRLFACACCRRIERLIYPPWDQVLEAAERFADRRIRYVELQGLRAGADPVHDETMAVEAAARREDFPIKLADDAAGYADQAVAREAVPEYPQNLAAWQAARVPEESAQCELLRDVFGNPFRPVAFSPSWRTDTAVSLARAMYESREFGAMPILADALQDAGCDNDDVLNHCRDPEQVHVRGCWVVDGALGLS